MEPAHCQQMELWSPVGPAHRHGTNSRRSRTLMGTELRAHGIQTGTTRVLGITPSLRVQITERVFQLLEQKIRALDGGVSRSRTGLPVFAGCSVGRSDRATAPMLMMHLGL
jgi:hypothetical protein